MGGDGGAEKKTGAPVDREDWLESDHRLILDAGQTLLQSDALFQHLVEVANEGVWIVDDQARTVFANPQLAEFFGMDPKSMAGISVFDFLFPEDAEDQRAQLRKRREGRSGVFERRFRRSDGVEIWALVSACPVLDASGRFLGSFAMLTDITVRKRTAAELLETTEELDRFFSVALDLFLITDLEGTILRCNRACEETLGFTSAELSGTKLAALFHPEDLSASRIRFEALLAGGTVDGFVNRCRCRDGSYRWLEWRASSRGSSVYAAARDISPRLQAESALQEQNSFRKAIIERAADGLCVYHSVPEFPFIRFTVWNQRMVEITGYSLEEINQIGWYQTVHSDPRPRRRTGLRNRTAVEDALAAGEWEITRKDGGKRIVLISTSLVTSGDGRPHVLGVVHDRTGQRQAEDERRRLEHQVQHVQKLESLGLLAGGIAHDFNNLLMAIMGNAELAALELPDGSRAQPFLADVQVAAQRASELCGQLLAYAGKGRFSVEPLDLNAVVEQMTRILGVSLSKKAALEFRPCLPLPAIEADPGQINQILMNLLTNASDAIGNKAGRITLETGVMHLDRDYLSTCSLVENLSEGRYVYFEVADNGCGMAPEVQNRIFDPFFSTKFTGRGLGMAAVLGIVRGHRGTIRIESREKAGTSVRVLFPASERVPKTHPSPSRTDLNWTGSGTVLVVEDEEPIRNLTCNLLERLGFRSLSARDGLQALAVYREKQSEIRAVLLDLTMPNMDGEEALLALRQTNPGVRVILCSGYDRLDVSRRFAGKGLAGFLQKPYQIEALRGVLQEVLGH